MRPDRNDVVSADLEVFGRERYPKGTGDATRAYVDAFEALVENVSKRRMFPRGFQTDSIQSDNAVAIYGRMQAAGMPIESGLLADDRYSDSALSMDWAT